MSKIFERLLQKRQITEEFLHPQYEDLCEPEALPDLKKAVARIKKAIKNQEKILIFGDYDADGVTASTVMYDALKLAGAEHVSVMLPDRFKDGYGMSERIFEKVKKEQITLVVTVDCGSANYDIIERLKKQKVDVIVTDHHECPEELPKAVAVVNPKRQDQNIPQEIRDLAGVGVAFTLARGLVQAGLIKNGQEKWLLDLVLIGTICDSMPMSLENRRLCYFGVKVLEKTRRFGLKELMRVAGVKKINGHALGFQIGPRLNAAGRMDTADVALDFLMATSRSEAAELAAQLEEYNKLRKTQQKEALQEIRERNLIGKQPVVTVQGDWHEGIIGIIAGQLMERHRKPAFVFSKTTDGLKGSGRSFGDFNLAEALTALDDVIERGGGHAAACGVSLASDNFEDFRTAINEHYKGLQLGDQRHFLIQKADLTVDQVQDLSLELLEELQQLEPYNATHTEPIFKLEKCFVQSVRKLGADQNHLCLMVRDSAGKTMKLLAFYAPRDWMLVEEGMSIDVLFTLMENEWNGVRSVEGRIETMMPAQENNHLDPDFT